MEYSVDWKLMAARVVSELGTLDLASIPSRFKEQKGRDYNVVAFGKFSFRYVIEEYG